jgi:hypothetical protein
MSGIAQPQPTPAERLRKLKQIIEHVMDMWPVVLKRRTYMLAMGRSDALREALGQTHAAHVQNALQDVLLTDLIIQICALILDENSNSASVARALSALRDAHLRDELYAQYTIVPPVARIYEDELDEHTRAEVAQRLREDELRRNLADFDELYAHLSWIESAVLTDEVAGKLLKLRNKAVAHYDLVREEADWKLWRIGGTGLTYGQLDTYIAKCTEAVDSLNRLVRRASYIFDELPTVAQKYVDEYVEALIVGLQAQKSAEAERRAEMQRAMAVAGVEAGSREASAPPLGQGQP